jgi:hypothetical protein
MKSTAGTFINAHKILVIPVVLGLMLIFNNWSTEAFVYLALHGTYSLLWLMKQTYYPDRRFAETVPVWIGILFIFVPLAGYYIAPYLLISRHVTLAPYVFAILIFLYVMGIFFPYGRRAEILHIAREGRPHRGWTVQPYQESELPRRDLDLSVICDHVDALDSIRRARRMGVRFLRPQHVDQG